MGGLQLIAMVLRPLSSSPGIAMVLQSWKLKKSSWAETMVSFAGFDEFAGFCNLKSDMLVSLKSTRQKRFTK